MRGLLKFLTFVAILLTPVLVSPALRTELGESLPVIGDQLFPENFWEEMAMGMVFIVGTIALLYAVIWLADKADSYSRGRLEIINSYLPGWKRAVFIIASLLMFSAAAGIWALGVVAVSQYAGETTSDGQGLAIFMLILMVFGIGVLTLAKPAYWAVRLLIKR